MPPAPETEEELAQTETADVNPGDNSEEIIRQAQKETEVRQFNGPMAP